MEHTETVYSRFARAATRWPERAFLNVLPETADIYAIAPGTISYAAMLAKVATTREAYRAAGYGPGHRVGLLLGNRPAFLQHWLALNAIGCGIVPINPDLKRAELEYLIAHSDMVSAAAVTDRHEDLSAAAPRLEVFCPDVPPSPVTGAGDAGDAGADPECALLYTSGTTGRPKGCILTNSYFLNCADWYAGVGGHLALHEDPPERMLTPLPLFHTNALAWSAMAMMTVGGCLSVLDRFHPSTWWDSVRTARATVIHYLGIMPPILMAAPESPAERDHQVRFGFGAGIPASLHEAAEARFGFPLVEGWAMTETGVGGIIMATEDPRKPGTACFGRPRIGVEARVTREDGSEASVDEPGELTVRQSGPNPRAGFFLEYLKDPEATAKAWAGGWLHTGDVVCRDADGDLHFVDRKKNIIRRSGENISAAEVEGVLARHPGVNRIAVAPVPDDLRGEEVLALVVPDGTPAPEDITRWCLTEMAYFKAPGWIAFVDELPLTSTEKLQRGALRELADRVMTDGSVHDTRPLKRRTT